MASRLDTIFWAYFDEYLKKDKTFPLRKIDTDSKQKINEIYDVCYFAIFQFKLSKNDSVSDLNQMMNDEFLNYLIENYKSFFIKTFSKSFKYSNFNLKDEYDLDLIKKIVSKLILVHIDKTSWIDWNEKYTNKYSWARSCLTSLALKYQHDLNYRTEDKKLYHSVVYPFLITCILIDVLDSKNMNKNIKEVFTKKNIIFAFKTGRSLSSEEKKWILPQLTLLKNEDEWNQFLLNFSEENWKTFDFNQRFRLIHDLSKLTTVFLKDEIYNISFISDGKEIQNVLASFLYIFILFDLKKRENIFLEIENKQKLSALFPINMKDFNIKWITFHLSKFKEYKKLHYKNDKIFEFFYSLKYVFDYLKLINLNEKNSGIISKNLINLKSIGLVQTLKIFTLKANKYKKTISEVNFEDINLDQENLKKLLLKTQRFEEIANIDSQMSIMLRSLTLLISIDYLIPKKFNYSVSELIKYYIIVFGPYKKSTVDFTVEDFEKIEIKVTKLLILYEKIKDKDLVLDSLGILYKLQNFS